MTAIKTSAIDLCNFLVGPDHDFFDFFRSLIIRPQRTTDENPIISRLHRATPKRIDGIFGDYLDDGGAAAIPNILREGCPLLCGEVKAFGSVERPASSPGAGLVPNVFGETLVDQQANVVSNLFIRNRDLRLQLDGAPRPFSEPQEDLVANRVAEDFQDPWIGTQR